MRSSELQGIKWSVLHTLFSVSGARASYDFIVMLYLKDSSTYTIDLACYLGMFPYFWGLSSLKALGAPAKVLWLFTFTHILLKLFSSLYRTVRFNSMYMCLCICMNITFLFLVINIQWWQCYWYGLEFNSFWVIVSIFKEDVTLLLCRRSDNESEVGTLSSESGY